MSTSALTLPLDSVTSRRRRSVADIHAGDTVVAEDGVLGRVEGVVRSEASRPVYLVVRAGRRLRRRYPVVPLSLVTGVDRGQRVVRIRGLCRTIRRLPEQLPLVL